jgi:hypothetical protein
MKSFIINSVNQISLRSSLKEHEIGGTYYMHRGDEEGINFSAGKSGVK